MSDYSDALASLIEPDILLPSQYNDKSMGGLLGGERKLMAALLSDGIEAYVLQKTSGRKKYMKDIDAECWIEDEDPSYVFSFDSVCECLGINAEYLRQGLHRYIERFEAQKSNGEVSDAVWKKIRRPRK